MGWAWVTVVMEAWNIPVVWVIAWLGVGGWTDLVKGSTWGLKVRETL